MERNGIALTHIRLMAQKMRSAGLGEIQWQDENTSVRLRFAPAAVQAPVLLEPESKPAALTPVVATLPGQVVLAHPSAGEPLVQPGQRVKQHQLLALLKVGPLYLPVHSPAEGRVIDVLVESGQIVEYGSEIMQLSGAD
ncbi:acetyl-CoA carboxylase biotin carboxyl carrier protein [Pantoea sp. A4]|uniref:acetyl-CoA carboxylase biotin carboxyl carrier protein n=1 Tax=Pantoea sp. A4 TaxID=1225184 RepID=UPI00037310F1|nr:acetyl-CoA carboxylase biotin carboxyl carrier protein subunit [Pantoea sp. A4]